MIKFFVILVIAKSLAKGVMLCMKNGDCTKENVCMYMVRHIFKLFFSFVY